MTSTDPDMPQNPDQPRRLTAAQAIRGAATQLAELLGKAPESVSSLQPQDGGWAADVEVVELERVPDTMSIMASYRITLDAEGQFLGANDAYLVPADRTEDFRARVLAAAEDLPGVRVELTGPWAPYSFALPPEDIP